LYSNDPEPMKEKSNASSNVKSAPKSTSKKSKDMPNSASS
jgi:hypothetical protein